LNVQYTDVIANPEAEAIKISQLLSGIGLDTKKMAEAVDAKLHRCKPGEK
jgi:hypothetical protein